MIAKTTPALSPPSGGGGYSDTTSIDPAYTVTLTASDVGGSSVSFETSIDETLAVSISSQWAAPFENLLGEFASSMASKGGAIAGHIGTAVGAGMLATGYQAKPKALTARVWQSSTPIEFTIPFTFVAINDPVADVKDKVVNLLKLCAPSQDSSLMISAPGPVMINVGQPPAGRKISLRIGRFMLLEPCLIEAVQVQFENVIGKAGIPLRAKVNVDIRSYYSMFTVQDIDKLFNP